MKYVVALLLAFSTAPASADYFSATEAWEFACQWSDYDCSGLEPPTYYLGLPEWTEGRTGIRGTYDDGIVYLSPYLVPGTDMMSTAIHETVHYFQDIVAGHPNSARWNTPAMKTLCGDEEEAFRVVDTWWRYIGMSEMQRGPNWWWSYDHCVRYYDPEWEEEPSWIISLFFGGLPIESW